MLFNCDSTHPKNRQPQTELVIDTPALAMTTPTAPQLGGKPRGLKRPRSDTLEGPLEKRLKTSILVPPDRRAKQHKKTVQWAEEEQLTHCFYFDVDVTERVNVNRVKHKFGPAMTRRTFESACWLYNGLMDESVPWTPPRPLTLPDSPFTLGANSTQRLIQQDREMCTPGKVNISKESLLDSPQEPDPEEYEPIPPCMIPLEDLDVDSSMLEGGIVKLLDSSHQVINSTSNPVAPAANVQELQMAACQMDTKTTSNPAVPAANVQELQMAAHQMDTKTTSNPAAPAANVQKLQTAVQSVDTNTTSNPPTPIANVQMLLPSLLGAFGVKSVKELIKQPAFKGLSGSLQQSQNQNQGRSPTVKRGLLGDRPSHPGRGPHMMDRPSGQGWGGQRQVPERPVQERRPSLMGPYPPRGMRPWSGTDGRQGSWVMWPQRRTHTNMKDMSNRPGFHTS